jgi:hypothetical protein
MFASLWPFGRQTSTETNKPGQTSVVNQVDESLKQKGVSPAQQATLKPPAADLPKNDDTPVQTMDSGKLMGAIDSNLNKGGKNSGELPPVPEAAAIFKEPAPARTATAKTTTQPPPSPSVSDSGLLGSIDQKLKSQGLQPESFETPSLPAQGNEASAKKSAPTKIELEPKVNVEKGPLFLAPEEVPQTPSGRTETNNSETKPESPEIQQPAASEAPRNLVRGPIQPQTSTKPPEPRKRVPGEEVESKGLLESIGDDIDGLSKMLNPFRW